MRVIAVRHFRTVAPEGVCYGRTDLAVAEGQDSAASKLIERLPAPNAIWTSPLRRCAELALLIGEHFKIAPLVDARLIEMDFGNWEMRPWSDIPRCEIDAWANDFMHARPHGGESVAMLRDRVYAMRRDLRACTGDALIITHAGVIRALKSTGNASPDWRFDAPFGAAVEIND